MCGVVKAVMVKDQVDWKWFTIQSSSSLWPVFIFLKKINTKL